MGLRTASVRRSYVEVMAPALTETSQKQSFKLPPKDQPDVPGGAFCKPDDDDDELTQDKLGDAINNLNTLALVSETLLSTKCCGDLGQASGNMSDKPMDDQDKMGLQKADSVSRVQNEVDQIFTDDHDDELMQVFKTDLNDDLPTNLTIEKFLTDVDMMNISMEEQQEIDPNNLKENQSKELIAELKKKQAKVERRLDFLRRKVHKLQARNMGQHVSGEVAGVFEYVHRSLKRLKEYKDAAIQLESVEDKNKPMSYGSTKALVKKLELAAALQASSVAKQKHLPKYFGSGSSEMGSHRINVPGMVNIPPWPVEHKQELQKVSGLLVTELSLVQREVDSEATESSSGGESCDEMQSYNNPHQQYLSIQKRALWKYATSRAAIAARWTWLQAQISDLEYRIRQHTDFHRRIRASKGEVQLGGADPPPVAVCTSPTAVNGYRGQLPGSSPLSAKAAALLEDDGGVDCQCARTRPLVNFKKRKLLQISGLHMISKKAARPSTIRCGCVAKGMPCAVCTGRTDPTNPRDPSDALSKEERIALVDSGFHPVFSLPEDVSYGVHCDAIMKTPEWQQRSTRMKSLKVLKGDRSDGKSLVEHRSKKIDHRKKCNRLLKPSTVSALSAKIKNKIRSRKTDGADEEVESIGNNSMAGNSAGVSPSSSPLLHMQSISGYSRRTRSNSYDIDNIVIPYSVAASTRVEKLQYKEILTPKWRIAEDFKCDTKNNGAVKNPTSQDSDVEDVSEDAVVSRHDKSEYDEKKKFLSYLKLPLGHNRPRAHKRTDSLAESSGANTPDPMSPHAVDQQDNTNSPLTSPPATPLPTEEMMPLPSISTLRRRTISQSRFVREREISREENNTPEHVEVQPFEMRTFPLDEEIFDKMLKSMPENHHLKTNYRSQDSSDFQLSYLDEKADSPGTESTESAIGEEDPNDPEWVDMERSRDRHKR